MLYGLERAAKLSDEAIMVPKHADFVNRGIVVEAEDEDMLTVEPQAAGGNAHEGFRLRAEYAAPASHCLVVRVPGKRLHGVVEIGKGVHQQCPHRLTRLLYRTGKVGAQGFKVNVGVFREKTQHTVDSHFLIRGKEFDASTLLAENVRVLLMC